MKLRNKKTGEIVELASTNRDYDGANDMGLIKAGQPRGETLPVYSYNSLAELNEEWEDYEEPKDFWYIDDFMIMCGTEGEFTTPELASFTKKDIEKLKAIGNYFETKEEAEKAVEKLKAWKRLKDKGFRVSHWHSLGEGCLNASIRFDKYAGILEDDKKDLDLLFGGEK